MTILPDLADLVVAIPQQEKQLKYTSLLTNCMILDNTIELSTALNALVREGYGLVSCVFPCE